MLAALCVKTLETAPIIQALAQRRGWMLVRDTMPGAHEHRAWTWLYNGDTDVLYREDRRFGARCFYLAGPEANTAERELREFLDFHEPESLFARVHSERAEKSERMRALFLTTCFVSHEAHDPAYERMLINLLEGEDEDMTCAALMIAERLVWPGLTDAVAEHMGNAGALSRIASRVHDAFNLL
jgi:hypothetical protein